MKGYDLLSCLMLPINVTFGICSLNGQYCYANLMHNIQLHSFKCQLMTEYWLFLFSLNPKETSKSLILVDFTSQKKKEGGGVPIF